MAELEAGFRRMGRVGFARTHDLQVLAECNAGSVAKSHFGERLVCPDTPENCAGHSIYKCPAGPSSSYLALSLSLANLRPIQDIVSDELSL